ncbi:MAG TPA: amidohydrolase family protein [Vicinamibacterales bacterium]|nr:amidohydrolase family protein [Vicinamibacterales bacterium]
MRGLLAALVIAAFPTVALAQPQVDHHQHLFSPALAKVVGAMPITAADLVRHLDDAGIARAVVLSTAYSFSNPARKVENDYDFVRADNDWTAAQVAPFRDRLIGFCGLNPIKDYALGELARCAKNPNLARGVKLHFGNSRVDYHNPQHLERVRAVFRAANSYGMAIAVHIRVNTSQKMSRDEAVIFLEQLLPAAPDVTVQIAHMGGAGGVEPEIFGGVLDVFVEAIRARDPRMKNVWFDATSVTYELTPENGARIAERIRQIGVERILFGSDAPAPNNVPRLTWAAFRKVPLTDPEFRTIETNIAPYLR